MRCLPSRIRAFVLVSVCFGSGVVAAQESADVTVENAIVKAGETVRFVVTVDQSPNIDDCNIQWYVGKADEVNVTQSGVALLRGQTTATIVYKVPFDSPAGRYALKKLVLMTPSARQIPLSSKPVFFDVIANTGIKYPSSAKVSISPSQAQLLRAEALALSGRLQELKGDADILQAKGERAVILALTKAVDAELLRVLATAYRFQKLNADAKLGGVARVFFDDLEVSYRRIQVSLKKASLTRIREQSFLQNVFFAPMQEKDISSLSGYLAREAVYRTVEQNELAYNLVAETGDMSFNLRVFSSPPGAKISYGRRGDTFTVHPDPTNSMIESLPLAIWIVRFQKESFKDAEREFSPFTERERVVNVTLQSLGK
jgi:hypothetical protein